MMASTASQTPGDGHVTVDDEVERESDAMSSPPPLRSYIPYPTPAAPTSFQYHISVTICIIGPGSEHDAWNDAAT